MPRTGTRNTHGRAGRWAAVVIVPLVVLGCAPADDHESSVEQYVNAAVEHMQIGLYAQGDEWNARLEEELPALRNAASIPQTHAGLASLARVAGGEHSGLLTPDQARGSSQAYGEGSSFPLPTVTKKDVGVSVLTLPSFNGTEKAAVDEYQYAALDGVASVRSATTCGWIVDLRTNGGGNAYPMLSAVAPLLSDGKVLGFTDRDSRTSWISVNGGGLQAPYAAVAPATPGFSIDQPVAILTGDGTASAAEAVVVAFSGQPNTARFGVATAGLTTSNEVFELQDEALLVMSTAYFKDRGGLVFDGPIEPDVSGAEWKTPRLVDDAAAWLRSQCA